MTVRVDRVAQARARLERVRRPQLPMERGEVGGGVRAVECVRDALQAIAGHAQRQVVLLGRHEVSVLEAEARLGTVAPIVAVAVARGGLQVDCGAHAEQRMLGLLCDQRVLLPSLRGPGDACGHKSRQHFFFFGAAAFGS